MLIPTLLLEPKIYDIDTSCAFFISFAGKMVEKEQTIIQEGLEGGDEPLQYRSYNLCSLYFNVHNIHRKAKNTRKIKIRNKKVADARKTRSEIKSRNILIRVSGNQQSL